MQLEELYDPWRCFHASERDYTFYSSTKKSYFRLDLFLVNKHLLQSVTSAQISFVIWSDHSPVALELYDLPSKRQQTNWRTTFSLLSHPSYQKIKSQTHQVNTGAVSDDALLWNTHKAYYRCLLIKNGEQEIKSLKQALSKLLQDIRAVDCFHKSTLNPQDEQNSKN